MGSTPVVVRASTLDCSLAPASSIWIARSSRQARRRLSALVHVASAAVRAARVPFIVIRPSRGTFIRKLPLGHRGVLVEVLLDMVEALGPGVQTPLTMPDAATAETTPEMRLVVSAHPATPGRVFDLSPFRDPVAPAKVLSEGFLAVKDLGALSVPLAIQPVVADPRLLLQMLRVLVSFPVVLAPKSFGAGSVGTMVRLLMPLHVLSDAAQSEGPPCAGAARLTSECTGARRACYTPGT